MRTLAVSFSLLVLVSCEDERARQSSSQQTPDMAQMHIALGIEQLQMQLRQNPNDFAALSRLGDLYFESGQYFAAIQTFDRALAVNPECADCLNDKGLAQYYSGDTQGALASLDQATTVDPAYPNAWLSKGYVLMSVGRYEEAIAPLNQVKAVDQSGVLAAEADKFLAMIAERN
jgi:tetratricopeptide (TPR) repeat protein